MVSYLINHDIIILFYYFFCIYFLSISFDICNTTILQFFFLDFDALSFQLSLYATSLLNNFGQRESYLFCFSLFHTMINNVFHSGRS